MNHFFCESISSEIGILNEQDSHHAIRVLRLKEGSQISVSANDGRVYLAEILNGSKNELRFKCSRLIREEIRPLINIAIAPTKSNDRFEWFLEKATEIGVANIYPILSANSERKIYKIERGEKVIMAAAKQSKKGFLPHLHELEKFSTFITKNRTMPKYMGHLVEGPKKTLPAVNFKEENLFLIGPEGDFNEKELDTALKAGFQAISLGDEVLRTETAGLQVAVAAALLR
jgi:16S rRNA (uracil1498-N3)-methyltransferase